MHRQIAGRLTGRITKWVVAVIWLLVVIPMAGLAGQLTDVQNNEASSWLPESAESTRAIERLEPFRDPDAIPTIVVHRADGGTFDREQLATLREDLAEYADVDGVSGEVLGPFVSADGEAAQTIVTFDFGSEGWNRMPDAAEDLREIAATDATTVYIAGPGGQAADAAEAFEGIDTTLILLTLGVVVVILLLTYRSPVLWLLPILAAVVAYFTSGGVVYLLAKYADLTVNGQSQAILGILVIGAGTDYALLLTARYREELRRHDDRHEAMAVALHRAAPAILASAATVCAGMLCLLAADLNSTRGLGPVAAVGIAVTFLVMVTFLPALLVICGRWVFWPKRPAFGSPEPTSSGFWARVGEAIRPRPRAVWVVTAAILAVACLGWLRLDTQGLATEDSYTVELESIDGQEVLTDHGLVDQSNTVQVVTDTDSVPAVVDALAGVDGLVPAERPVVQGDTAFVEAVLDGADVSSTEAFDVVEAARDAVHAVPGTDSLVGGTSAVYLDTKTAANRDNLVIIPLILVVVLLILMALLRALVAPLVLIATVVLSFGAALGISALLFEYVFGFAGSDPGFPLFAFVFLVALGIDYNIFLMTRVREETAVRGTRQGALVALASTGGVITSAGVVLAATFLMLGTIPVVFLAELGVTVALGVLLDTLVVRSVLVTALTLDIGSRMWWPSRLDRTGPPEDRAPAPEAALRG
ncbi:MMPL family transporter [Nocardioides ochotonae]|uniref:MMPL family transporter n=1 Tax=Nocardioides ochotonae TaxID=2685869 RepID=UPI00140BC5DF|nr:MMPL family transporter [Nocardioides ochotonae]